MPVSVTISYTILSDPAVSATFTPAPGPFNAPLPAGTVIGSIAVLPSDWNGQHALSGAQAGGVVIVPTGTPGLFNVQTIGVQPQGSYSVPDTLTP